MSEQELFKQMELGKLYAKDVLPLVAKEMKNVANSGGALEEKYKTTRVAQGRFFNQLELAQNKIFKSGFDEGLAGLFNNLTSTFEDNQSVLKDLGDTFGMLFKALTAIMRFLTPFISSLIRGLNSVASAFVHLKDNAVDGLIVSLGLFSAVFGKSIATVLASRAGLASFARFLALAFKSPYVIVMGILAALDEFRAYFDADLIGMFDDEGMSKAQRDKIANERKAQFGLLSANDLDKQRQAALAGNDYVSARMAGNQAILARKSEEYSAQGEDFKAAAMNNFLMRLSASAFGYVEGSIQDKYYNSAQRQVSAIQNMGGVTINVSGVGSPEEVANRVEKKIVSTMQPAYGGR